MEQSLEASRHVAASAASACSPGSTETEFAGLCFLRLALEGGRVSGEAPPGSGSAKKRSMVACQHKKETTQLSAHCKSHSGDHHCHLDEAVWLTSCLNSRIRTGKH